MKKTRYAVVDLETTGTGSVEESRIIQIGCAFIEGDQITETYQTKINPQMTIPKRISRLTGITDQQVRQAPKFADVADKIYQKLAGTVFVAHNVNFDFPFLNRELVRSGYPELDLKAIDTVTLSQVLFSRTRGYRLRDLTNYLHIEHDDPHSADSDAVATAHLFLKIKAALSELPIVTLEQLVKLGDQLPLQTATILEEALQKSKRHPNKLPDDLLVVDGLAIKRPAPLNTGEEVNVKKEAYPQTKRSKIKLYNKTLKWRKSQATLMNYVYQQFSQENEERNIVVEAPTGMGKTLGYLLPLSYVGRQRARKVVISVPTTVLQNQVLKVGKEQLNPLLRYPRQFAVLKGSSNYLNLDLFAKKIATPTELSKDGRLLAMKILVWLTTTETGDFDEINYHVGFGNSIDQFRHAGATVLSAQSPFYSYDFYRRAKTKLKFADFIITNHAYLAHHSVKFNVQERAPYLVIDEAQHFAQELANLNQQYLDLNELMMEAHRLVSRLLMNHHDNLMRSVMKHPLAGFHIRRFVNSLEKINRLISQIQGNLYEHFVQRQKVELVENQPAEIAIDEATIQQLNQNEFNALTQELANTFIEFDTLDRYFKQHDLGSVTNEAWRQIGAFQGNLTKFYDAIRDLKNDSAQSYYWITLGPNHDAGSIRIGRGVVNPGEFYQKEIVPAFAQILLIGGTLFVGNHRDYFLDKYALTKENAIIRSFNTGVNFAKQLDFEVLDSSFTLDPDTSPKAYERFLANAIVELTEDVNRQTLVLFNSLDTIEKVYTRMMQEHPERSRKILAQGVHGSRAKIIREFNDEDNAILLGAASFWEGIDFPGDRLEYLIVTRLPFRSPGDKLVQLAAKRARNPFRQFTLPDALLTFKQGLGRVIRNSDDTGAVVMLDNRIMKRRYGKQFIHQLPNGVEAHYGKIDEIKTRVADFFK